MMTGIAGLFDTSDFPPRWTCGTWTPLHGWMHIVADAAIWGAYTMIPAVLAYFILKRRDVPFPRIFWLFCLFILSCGTNHLMESAIFWWPAYRFAALLKVLTAVASWATVLALIPTVPKALSLPGLAKINSELTREMQERRRIEAAQRAGESQLRAIFDHASDAIITVGERGDISAFNRTAERLFGYEASAILGKSIWSLLGPGDGSGSAEAWWKQLQGAVASSQDGRLTATGWRRDGHPVPVELSVGEFQILSAKHYVAILRDIRERKRAEERFRIAVEAAPSATVMTDAQGRILLINAQTETMFGYQREELLGNAVETLVPRRFREAHPQFRGAFFADPHARPMGAGRDLYGLHKDGHEFPVEIGLNPIRTDEGLVVLASIVDITERKRAEASLQSAHDELLRRNEEMEQFTYTVSHDLKSPLVNLQGFAAYLARDVEAGRTDRIIEFTGHITHAVGKMRETIDALLEISRAGRVSSDAKPVHVRRLVDDWVTAHAESIARAGASVLVASESPVISFDPARLHEVLDNLLTNALKYGCPSPGGRIEVGWERRGGEIRFFVRDHGPGIAPHHHKRIFELFQRLHRHPEGTGVGLSLVKRVIEHHRGRVWVESEEDRGACFWFSLPADLEINAKSGTG
ncbi:MAG: Adaptive-response sensory-kinase SasA [Phycisphaerae bacterium]|nr:Adaptive-response sensory-kinase SasA [Phycisphaerae bacterium]